MIHGHFTVPQGKNNPHPGSVREHGKHLDRELDVLTVHTKPASIHIFTHMKIIPQAAPSPKRALRCCACMPHVRLGFQGAAT
ncbi:hypothetical protein Pure05_36120 [Paenarthrobacter ureafaciens]|nr:hypothetical protein Pure01_36100 [Paenarthrobacter ureafaciens]GLU65366.1 hypothetical protein Pure02_36160 [Paenarthrobacter ureafaciens]GLU69753.1 hypothetical protein Pure03_37290 [Paenarthrobacter ureafaciens]GLU73930.1 hypothetical protein Pure04_36450 [Paenarthrobacter ureafaciens]GLU78172.1 hypothetical protein Pure05_36120 [Paenarthrobacter ureafaciens]